MPVDKCMIDGRPGFRWGGGKCYTYNPDSPADKNSALRKAVAQGAAARAAGYTGSDMEATMSGVRHEDPDMRSKALYALMSDIKDILGMMDSVDKATIRKILSKTHDRYSELVGSSDMDGRETQKQGQQAPLEAVGDPTPEERKGLPPAAYEPAAFFDDDQFVPSRSKLPHHINTAKDPNSNDTVDVPRLRNALARFDQVDWSGFPKETMVKTRAHLERHADAILKGGAESKCRGCSEGEISLLMADLSDFRAGRFGSIRERHRLCPGP